MISKQKQVKLFLAIYSIITLLGVMVSPMVSAQTTRPCTKDITENCVNTSIDEGPVDTNENPIIILLADVVNFLLVGVFLVVIGAIVVSGVQYMISQGNPQATTKARERIVSSVIALVLYALMYALLQWLIPGGVFG